MPSIAFCRMVRFTANHHYALPDASMAENERLFGESAKPHSHDWQLTIWLEGEPDPRTGMSADLLEIDRVLQGEVVGPLNGRSFREYDPTFFQMNQPTNEVLAGYFADKLKPFFPNQRLIRVRVAECDSIFAEWSL